MSILADYIEDQKAQARVAFEAHKASVVAANGETTIINWQKPGTWNYGVRFLLHRRWLMVIGDLGEATYQWSEDISLTFLSSLEFRYFHSKCMASETGKPFLCWHPQVGIAHFNQWMTENGTSIKPKVRAMLTPMPTCEDNVQTIMHLAYSAGLEAEDAAAIVEGFRVPAPRCILHFVGIQMVAQQLNP